MVTGLVLAFVLGTLDPVQGGGMDELAGETAALTSEALAEQESSVLEQQRQELQEFVDELLPRCRRETRR